MPDQNLNEPLLEAILVSQEKGLKDITQSLDNLIVQKDKDKTEPLLSEVISGLAKVTKVVSKLSHLTSKDIEEIKKEATPIKGKDYQDGKPGKDAPSVDTGKIIKEVLDKIPNPKKSKETKKNKTKKNTK